MWINLLTFYMMCVFSVISQRVINESCYGEICYQVLELDTSTNMPGATGLCALRGLEGGVFFESSIVNAIDTILSDLGVQAWIGMRLENMWNWRWYDGSPVTGVTKGVIAEGNCLSLKSGILYIDNCNSEYQCLCQKSHTSQEECQRLGGHMLNNECVYDTTRPEKWVECARTCKSEGGQISTDAIINNLAMASVIADFYSTHTWVGITKSFLKWTRPSPLDPFTLKWATNGNQAIPNYQSNTKRCGKLGSGGLQDTHCGEKLSHVVCLKAPPDYVYQTTSTTVAPAATTLSTTTTTEATTTRTTTTSTTTTISTTLPTTTTASTTQKSTTSHPTSTKPAFLVKETTTVPVIAVAAAADPPVTVSWDATYSPNVTIGYPREQLEIRTEQTVEIVKTQFPIWIVIGILVGVILLAIVIIVIVMICMFSRSRKKNKIPKRAMSSVSTAPMIPAIDAYGGPRSPIGSLGTLGRHTLSSIPDHITVYEPSLRLDGDLKIQEEFTYPGAEIDCEIDLRRGNMIDDMPPPPPSLSRMPATSDSELSFPHSHVPTSVSTSYYPHSTGTIGTIGTIGSGTYDKLNHGFQYQHPLYTGKQSEPKHLTPYSMSTMDRAKYGVYADIYVTPDFMDYGKVDVGKKKKFKKHSKIFGRKRVVQK